MYHPTQYKPNEDISDFGAFLVLTGLGLMGFLPLAGLALIIWVCR